ncbi:MAG TPA: DUF5916 domain-containing protein [Gemmatimonadales bacterium]|nr:DUF5916 domain-containing protein [Gemmatimonadales bacterium]
MLIPVLLLLQAASPPAPPGPSRIHHGRDGALAVEPPREEVEVAVDGVLDEPVWGRAAVLTGFSQFAPRDGIPAADSTEVLVWYSSSAIHFGIRAYEPHGAVHATLADRDRIFADDHVQILLGTFNDGRQASVFVVNPLGVQADGALVETGRAAGGLMSTGTSTTREPTDLSPDYVFQSKGRLTDYGYEVEVRIPFKSLRYQAGEAQTWRLNVVRQVQHSGYEDTWAPARRSAASFLGQSGRLVGLTGLRRGLVLDFTPELTMQVNGAPDGSGWSYDARDPELGGTVRWGVTNNLTLNGTANPDFSQVESDAGQLVFDPRQPLFFEEKRPFFIDGIEQFSTPNSLVYTRRIVQPVAAVKLTGKAFGTDVGVLSAVDDDLASRSGEDHPVFNILRLQRDLGRQSRLGVVYTDRIEGDDYNRVLAADGRLVFGGIYSANFQLGASRTRLADATREGPIWHARFARNGRSLFFAYSINGRSHDFLTRSGFIGRPAIVNAALLHRYIWYGKPGALVEQFRPEVVLDGTWKYQAFVDGEEALEKKLHLNLNSTLRGGWRVGGSVLIEEFRLDPDLYAGDRLEVPGPGGGGLDTIPFDPSATPAIDNLDWVLRFNTPDFRHFSANGFVLWGHDENFFEWASGELLIINGGLTWRPTDQLRVNATYQHQQVNRRRDGSRVDVQRIPRLKLEYQLSRPIFLRLIGEYFTQETDALRDEGRTGAPILKFDPEAGDYVRTRPTERRRLRGDLLFSYQPNPGTVFFAGYGSTAEEPNPQGVSRLRRTRDALFVKASYLFRM